MSNSLILTTIMVSYNTCDLTLEAVRSVLREYQGSPLLKKAELIVVDNASQDQTVTELRRLTQQHPNLHLITNRENAGFATANNQGILEAKGEYLLLLNSDTIVQTGALTQMVQAFEQHPIIEVTANLQSTQEKIDRLGVLAATLVNPDGTIQPQGGSTPNLVSLTSHMLMLDDIPVLGKMLPSTQHTGFRQTEKLRYALQDPRLLKRDWVGGTAMMIRRAVIDEIGSLDQNIFMYGEDVEFCLRAQNHHWDVAIHPTAKIVHIGSASSSSRNAIVGEFRGYLYLWSKHKPFWQIPLVKLILTLGALARALIFGTILRDSHRQQIYWKLAGSLPKA